MRIVLWLVMMFVSEPIFCQSIEIQNKSADQLLKDSSVTTEDKKLDSLSLPVQVIDKGNETPYNYIDTNYMIAHHEENNARQKKSTILRLVIGAGLLGVLIFRMRKKSKK